MHLGQTMLALASLVMVSVISLNVNRRIVEGDDEMYEAESIDFAVGFAQGILYEISSKKFDENAVDSVLQDPSEFTSPFMFDPVYEGEILPTSPDTAWYKSIGTFDDVDDYNGYIRKVNTARIEGFIVKVEVYYVADSDPEVPVWVPTYNKRVVVTVEHAEYMKYLDRATFATIIGY